MAGSALAFEAQPHRRQPGPRGEADRGAGRSGMPRTRTELLGDQRLGGTGGLVGNQRSRSRVGLGSTTLARGVRRSRLAWPSIPAAARCPASGTPSTATRTAAVLRGADGRGGLLLRLLAALPPRDPVGDRRRPGVGAARPEHRTRTSRCCRGTCALHDLFDDAGSGDVDASPAAGWCWATTTCASRYAVAGAPSPLYRNAIGDECVYVEAGTATVETVFGALDGRRGRLRRHAAGDHAPLAADRREPLRAYCIEANSHIAPPKRYLSRFGQLLEHAPYCERDLHGPGEPVLRRGHRRRGATSSTAARVGRSSARVHVLPAPPVRRGRLGRLPLPVHVQRRATSSRSPAGCTSRRRCTRSSRATTS